MLICSEVFDTADMLFTDLGDRQLFANEKFQEIYDCRLRKLVEQHIIIIEYVLYFYKIIRIGFTSITFLMNVCFENFSHTQDLRQALSAPMLGQCMASGILMCLAAYQITVVFFLINYKNMLTYFNLRLVSKVDTPFK